MAEVFEDSYSAEALANMENYIISFGTMIKDVGSSEGFKNALFGIKVMIDKKPRRVADISKIYTGRAPRTLELLVFSREHIPLVVAEIKESGFKNVKADSQQQLITVVVPKPTLDDLTAMEDQVAGMSRSAISSLTKIRGNTSQRLKAALENEFIDGVTMNNSRNKVDAVYDKYVKLVKLHALKKRKTILGSYFEPKNEEERLLLPELNKLKPLPQPKE
jgi:ribosome recycling factor